MNSKQVILIFLIIGALGVAVGFNVAGVSKFSDASVSSLTSTSASQSVQSGTTTPSQSPTTRDELLTALRVNGISDAITMPSSYFHGTVVNDYQDILKLAVKSEYVIISEDGIAVLVGLNGKEFQWVTGTKTTSKFEKIEIQSATCGMDGQHNWVITLFLKNSGTVASTLTSVSVNGRAATVSSTTPTDRASTITTNVSQTTIESGQSISVLIWIGGSSSNLTSGTAVNIAIQSAGGMNYIKLIELV
jgi:hypothetical protein